jgi:hypothetical protein
MVEAILSKDNEGNKVVEIINTIDLYIMIMQLDIPILNITQIKHILAYFNNTSK